MASDDRSHELDNSQNHTNSQKSYKSVAESTNQVTMFPKKDQGIVLNATGDLRLTDYVTAIGSIIGPRNILFASRMSNDRYCLYLKTKLLVDEITEKYKTVKIKEWEVGLRKLITPAKRIILSNVCPTIPHSVLEESLKALGLRLVSPINFLRASIQDEEYRHILSFRRQVYIPEQELELPSSIVLKFEEINYRIFMTFDELKCFKCNQLGHTAAQCTDAEPTVGTIIREERKEEEKNSKKRPLPSSAGESEETERTELVVELIDNPMEHNMEANSSNIQSPSSTPLPVIQEDPHKDLFVKPLSPVKHKPKKLKKSPSAEPYIIPDAKFNQAKTQIEQNPDSYILNAQEFKSFFENVKGSEDPVSIARQYTDNIKDLIDMLRNLAPLFPERTYKARCTRLANRLSKLTEEGDHSPDHSESDTASSSQEYF